MSDKKAQVLVLDPPVDLVFKGPFTEVVTSQLTLQNPSNEQVIFKVKTTAPKQYCVRPNSGLLQPQEKTTISVMLQPFEYNSSDKSKHKFMVQTMYAPPDFQVESLDAVWKDANKTQLMDSKLRCVFVESSDASGNAQSQVVAPPPSEATSNASIGGNGAKVDLPPAAPAASPKQEEEAPAASNIQSNAGSTPAHVVPVQKESIMEKATVESKVRMLQDKIDKLHSENAQLKEQEVESTNKKVWGKSGKFGRSLDVVPDGKLEKSDGLRHRLGSFDDDETMLEVPSPGARNRGRKTKPVIAVVLVLVLILAYYYFME